MYFKNIVSPNSDKRIMAWYAKYFKENGEERVVDEFDGENWSDFKNLEKNKIKEFGLYGAGSNIWFDTRDGIFHITSHNSSIGVRAYLEDAEENRIKLIDKENVKYNDIIQYKGFVTFMSPPNENTRKNNSPLNGPCNTIRYCIGYKYNYENIKGSLFVTLKIMVDLELREIILFTSLTPSFDYKGFLNLNLNERIIRGNITLEANKKKENQITICKINGTEHI